MNTFSHKIKIILLALSLGMSSTVLSAGNDGQSETQEIEATVTIPNDGSAFHTVSGIGKIVGKDFDPKNVRVSLDGGKTWIVPDSVVVRLDGTFAWAKSTNIPPGKIVVEAAIFNPETAAMVKTELVAAVQVSQKPPQVAAAARAVETVRLTAQQQQQQQQQQHQSESQINNRVLTEQVRQAASPS